MGIRATKATDWFEHALGKDFYACSIESLERKATIESLEISHIRGHGADVVVVEADT